MAGSSAPLMFDDLPSDNASDAPTQPTPGSDGAPLMFDDIPSFDSMPSNPPQSEGFVARTARTVAHNALPAAAGYAGAGAGAELGAAAGTAVFPGVGTVVGGLVGGAAGALTAAYGAAKAQKSALNELGYDDSAQMAADEQAHPYETFVTQLGVNMAGGGADAGASLVKRGASAVLQGGLEAGQEYASEGKVSPSKVLTAAGVGALLPGENAVGERLRSTSARAGEKIAKRVAGRPNVVANPDAELSEDEAGSSKPPVSEGESAFVNPPPSVEGRTVGNPQSQPVRSDRVYSKDGKVQSASPDMLTEGDYSPDIAAALQAFRNAGNPDVGNPKVDVDASLKEAPVQTGFPTPTAGAQQLPDWRAHKAMPFAKEPGSAAANWLTQSNSDELPPAVRAVIARLRADGMSAEDIENYLARQNLNMLKPTLGLKRTPSPALVPEPAPQTAQMRDVSAPAPEIAPRAPEPGQAPYPTAPVPAFDDIPAPAAEVPTPTTTHPDVAKVAAVRDDVAQPVSAAQAEAGNYAKGHPGRLFGREVSIETPKGGERVDTKHEPPEWRVPDFPYDYGEFLGTKGNDGDRVDVGIVGTGDRHFIIDQKDPATGEFDEHKPMVYAKDPVDALDHYERGFTDGSGPSRVGAITEVSPDEMTKWLAQPGKKKTPFNPDFAKNAAIPAEGVRPLPKIVTAAVTKMRAASLPEDAVQRLLDMEPSARIGAANKYVNESASVSTRPDRIRTAPPKVEGLNVTARDKADKAGIEKNVNALDAAFKATEPPPQPEPGANGGPALERETKAETVARARKFMEMAKDADFIRKGSGKPYRPVADNHAPTAYEKAAKKLLTAKNPTNKSVEAFRAHEALLRSIEPGDVATARATGRIESDIGLSRRSGDDAIAGAESQAAGSNHVEDNMIEAFDRARERDFKGDIPHEEPEAMMPPERGTAGLIAKIRGNQKTLDTTTPPLDMSSPHDRAQLADALSTKRSTTKGGVVGSSKGPVAIGEGSTPEAPKASPVRHIDVKTLDPEYVKQLLTGAASPRANSRLDSDDIIRATKAAKNPTTKSLGEVFMRDEGASLNINKIAADIKRLKENVPAYFKHQRLESYIARPAKTPAEQYARSLSNEAVKVQKGNEQQLIDLQKWSDSLPKELNNPATLRRIYDAREGGTIATLGPKEQALYNKYLVPLFNENDKLFDLIKDTAPKNIADMLGPKVAGDHIYRIAKGDTPDHNVLASDETDDPIISGRRGLPTSPTTTMLNRKFFSLADPKGNRFLIAPNEEGFTVWHNRRPIKVVDPKFAYKHGEPYSVGGKTFTMKEAMTHEIEQHALFGPGEPAKYYRNAALSAAMANYDLGKIARYTNFVESFKKDPEFLKYARAPRAKAPTSYLPTKLANFKDWHFDPQLAYALDDIAQPGINEDAVSYLRRISQAITKTIFWMPVGHIANVGAHWFVGRGYRWAVPSAYRTLANTSLEAIKSVVGQDDLQRQLRLHGASTMAGGVFTQDAVNNMARGFGEAVKRQPAKWDPIAKQFGLGPSDLVRAVYQASRHIMWPANDMFLTQAVLERMHEGMDIDQAIIHAERHIPNYRVPATVLGTGRGARVLAQLFTEPAYTVFGRYHWGIFNAYANTARDLVKGNGAAKLEAVGNLMAMGLLAYAVYPAMDMAAQYLTGNKHAQANRRGPMTIPAHLVGALQGKEDITAPLKSAVTVSPLLTTAMQQLTNMDYRGKPIVERGLVGQAARGNVRAAGQAATEEADFMGRNLFSPYNTFANAMQKGQGAAATLRDQALDIKDPSQRAVAYQARAARYNAQSLKSRDRHGTGPLERVYNRLTK